MQIQFLKFSLFLALVGSFHSSPAQSKKEPIPSKYLQDIQSILNTDIHLNLDGLLVKSFLNFLENSNVQVFFVESNPAFFLLTNLDISFPLQNFETSKAARFFSKKKLFQNNISFDLPTSNSADSPVLEFVYGNMTDLDPLGSCIIYIHKENESHPLIKYLILHEALGCYSHQILNQNYNIDEHYLYSSHLFLIYHHKKQPLQEKIEDQFIFGSDSFFNWSQPNHTFNSKIFYQIDGGYSVVGGGGDIYQLEKNIQELLQVNFKK